MSKKPFPVDKTDVILQCAANCILSASPRPPPRTVVKLVEYGLMLDSPNKRVDTVRLQQTARGDPTTWRPSLCQPVLDEPQAPTLPLTDPPMDGKSLGNGFQPTLWLSRCNLHLGISQLRGP
jgi:hypothetical protein